MSAVTVVFEQAVADPNELAAMRTAAGEGLLDAQLLDTSHPGIGTRSWRTNFWYGSLEDAGQLMTPSRRADEADDGDKVAWSGLKATPQPEKLPHRAQYCSQS